MRNGLRTTMSHDLIQVLQNLGRPRVLVLGDLILDRYIWGDAERVSQEAPVILLQADRSETRLGGAANVAHLLRGLEAKVSLAGVVGNDRDGQEVVTTETGSNWATMWNLSMSMARSFSRRTAGPQRSKNALSAVHNTVIHIRCSASTAKRAGRSTPA